MRVRYDQFDKQMVRDTSESPYFIETDAEVPANTRRIDLWATPREPGASLPEDRGLLASIFNASPSITLEFFHDTPSGEELGTCLIKHGEFRRFLSRRKTPPALLPIQWVISSGRPDDGINGLGFRPLRGALRGIYEGPALQYTRLVVVSELPVTRYTLLVRLLGAGSVLRQAIAELQVLPAEALERRLAVPNLLRFALTVPTDPAQRTRDDEEFLMDTQDIVEAWRQEAVQQGLEQGERKVLLRQLRRRFGAEVDGEIERRVAAASAGQIEVWTERVLSAGTLAELLAD